MGAFGEIAKVFQGLGLAGAVVLALLVVIYIQYRMNMALLLSNDKGRAALISAMENSTTAQLNVAIVLSRLESNLGRSA